MLLVVPAATLTKALDRVVSKAESFKFSPVSAVDGGSRSEKAQARAGHMIIFLRQLDALSCPMLNTTSIAAHRIFSPVS